MFELSSETKVSELQAQSAAMMAALKSTGIFREGDDPDQTINELCLGYALNPVIILRTLMQAWQSESPLNIDVSELDGLALTQVVEHIERTHHDFLRETLPAIETLIDRVAVVHGGRDDQLAEVHQLLHRVATDLENHLRHEEEALFVMVRDMEAEGGINPTRCGEAVGGPILCMENEHEALRQELERLRALTDDYAEPDYADAAYRELLGLLREFDQNTVVHMHKEDQVLFPRAIEAQAALREGE